MQSGKKAGRLACYTELTDGSLLRRARRRESEGLPAAMAVTAWGIYFSFYFSAFSKRSTLNIHYCWNQRRDTQPKSTARSTALTRSGRGETRTGPKCPSKRSSAESKETGTPTPRSCSQALDNFKITGSKSKTPNSSRSLPNGLRMSQGKGTVPKGFGKWLVEGLALTPIILDISCKTGSSLEMRMALDF